MAALKITKRAVDAAPAPIGNDAYYWDPELKGFGLRVTPRGVKSFVVQYRLRGRPARRMTIGRYGPLTPEDARKKAKVRLQSVADGVDPVEAQRAKARDAADLPFEKYVGRFVELYLKEHWPESWHNAKARLDNHVVPHLRGRPLPEIKRHEITEVIDRLRKQRALARNLHAVLRKLFAWAVNRGDIEASPMSGMKGPPAVQARKRVLTPDELVALWRATFQLTDPSGPFVRLLVTTLQRRNEVAGLSWQELSQATAMWRLPGERAKNGAEHLVPLNALAMAEVSRGGWKRRGRLFTTTGKTPISGFTKIKARLDEAMVPILQQLADDRADALGEPREAVTVPRWTFHDIRRSGTTQMQALGVPIETTERVINHISGEASGIRAVYNLHAYEPEKRAALNAWGSYLERLIKGAEAPNVVPIAARS